MGIYYYITIKGVIYMSTAIIGTIVIGAMVFVAIKQFKKSKSGGSGCGCGCSGCSSAKSCHGINIVNK